MSIVQRGSASEKESETQKHLVPHFLGWICSGPLTLSLRLRQTNRFSCLLRFFAFFAAFCAFFREETVPFVRATWRFRDGWGERNGKI